MAKLTGIEVAKFLAKQSKADRNYIERATKDFKKRGGKGKRRKSKKASASASATAPARKSAPKKKAKASSKPAFKPSPSGAAAESTGG